MCRVSREEKDVLWCLLAAHYKLRSSIPIQLHFKIFMYKHFTLLCIHGPDEWRPGRTPLCSGHTEGLCHETQLGQVSATPAPSSLGGHLESWQKAWEGEGAGNTWAVSPVLSLCSGSFCKEASLSTGLTSLSKAEAYRDQGSMRWAAVAGTWAESAATSPSGHQMEWTALHAPPQLQASHMIYPASQCKPGSSKTQWELTFTMLNLKHSFVDYQWIQS